MNFISPPCSRQINDFHFFARFGWPNQKPFLQQVHSCFPQRFHAHNKPPKVYTAAHSKHKNAAFASSAAASVIPLINTQNHPNAQEKKRTTSTGHPKHDFRTRARINSKRIFNQFNHIYFSTLFFLPGALAPIQNFTLQYLFSLAE